MNYQPSINRTIFSLALCITAVMFVELAPAQQVNWIWTPQKPVLENTSDSQGECYFRKEFTLIRPESAELIFAAGDEFEIYINGQLASRGQSYGSISKIDVTGLLESGTNLVAGKVRHNNSSYVGLALKLRVKEQGESRWRSLTTDDSWRTRLELINDWEKNSLNDMGWLKANTLVATDLSAEPGSLAANAKPKEPQDPAIAVVLPAGQQAKTDPRFEVDPEFVVQQVLSPLETGSLIAMEINEFGHLLLSREGGPLLIADPTQPLNHPARVRVYCDQVTSCQGILPLNGNVYVTGQGPQGLGLYRLADEDRDGKLEVKQKLAGFTGKLGEHGPHGLQLGPDGMIYVIIGNGSQLDRDFDQSSPLQNYYEGDLVPRYEDPGGHAQGVKAPGGTVVRLSLDGTKAELVAGGIRNAYDLAFDDRGELFIHDSDMESDMGTTWYRPTYVFHVPDGAEFGWRSGWAKFPQHFVDQTPAICETGRGSPTGAVFYEHLQFPVRYQNTMFLADWSEGRIMALRKQPSGAGFIASPEVFLTGQPLNVCDLAVAEDGGLYFCTGGRGTAGGVYRVVWNGSVPDKMLNFESDLARIIRHPQPGSAWARQNIAELKKTIGDAWEESLIGVAGEVRNPSKFRIRALQMMVLYGPAPPAELLAKLATDSNADVRAQVARLCGLPGIDESAELLISLIDDSSPLVRRIVCESHMRKGITLELNKLIPLLKSPDRIEALVARRLLEQTPIGMWEQQVLNSDDKRVFIQGAVALMTADPTLERAYSILAQASKLMEGFVNDVDFVDLLRTMQLAAIRGEVNHVRVPGLKARIGNEFPSGSSQINHELARLMAYLKIGSLDGRIEEYLQSEETPLVDRVHVAMYLQTVGNRLTDEIRLAIIDCLESARHAEGTGGSYELYLKRAVQDVSATLTEDQHATVMQNGTRWPNAVLGVFHKLPEKLDQPTVDQVIELDRALLANEDAASKQLRLGIVAILARSGGAHSMDYLRQLWQTEEDRRNDIVIGLAQQPDGENWAYLVSSLAQLDDLTGREVVGKLAEIPQRPRNPKFFRDLIELGYRLRSQGAIDAVHLLEHWTGEKLLSDSDDWQSQLKAWQIWFQSKWPDQPSISVEDPGKSGRHSLDQIMSYLETNGMGDAQKGRHLFTTAQCAMCHQKGTIGQNLGPDLNSLAQRFSAREMFDATLEPSKTIPDQYASKIVLATDGRQYTGMAMKQTDGTYVILQNDGKRVRIPFEEIDEVRDAQVSVMPTGLLDEMSMSEIADLAAFIMDRNENLAEQKTAVQQPVLIR